LKHSPYWSGPVATTYVYDTNLNSWSAGTALTSNRISPCAAVYNGAIYITGGRRLERCIEAGLQHYLVILEEHCFLQIIESFALFTILNL